MSEMKKNVAKCTTPAFRVSFPHLYKAHSGFEGQEAKFDLTMLFDKKTDLAALKAAANAAAVKKWGADKAKWPKGMRSPFRDGDEKSDLQGYNGMIFVKASSKQRPGVVDQARQPIDEDSNQLYAGCYARATLIAFAYEKGGNRGVSFSLQNVQKVRDGTAFSGRKAAEDDFDDVEELGGDSSELSEDDDAGF